VARRLMAIAVAGLACSSRAPEHPEDATRVPVDLSTPSIVRQAEGVITGPDEKPVAGALVSVIDQNSYRAWGSRSLIETAGSRWACLQQQLSSPQRRKVMSRAV
jgi:murein endopeptidase